MRFERYPRWSPYEVTARKEALYQGKLKRQLVQAGMFADQVAQEQLPVDAEMERRRLLDLKTEATWRKWRADRWRKGRRELEAMPKALRDEFLNAWNFPRDAWTFIHPDATRFCDAITQFKRAKGLEPPCTATLRVPLRPEPPAPPALPFEST